MEKYLLRYLKENSESLLKKKYLDYLKVNLDSKIYAYGENMNMYYPEPQQYTLRVKVKEFLQILKSRSAITFQNSDKNVLTFVRFPDYVLSNYNLNFLSSIFSPICKYSIKTLGLVKTRLFLSQMTCSYNFNDFLDEDLYKKLEDIRYQLLSTYSNYNLKCLFVGNGEPFLYKLHLDIFKELGRPSFIFLHGLPGIYDLETEKKADYLLVWGEQIKKNYVAAGFEEDKIVVVGSPKYRKCDTSKLRNSLEDILVTTSASIDWSPFGWDYNKFAYNDRSFIVLYCYSIQTVLQKVGIKHVRLRLHPSVGREWIEKFIDRSFFSLDYLPLQDSLEKASLVIGPTSTVWLESLLAGVNYLVYEPGDTNINFKHTYLVPPFDNSDEGLIVANTEEELYEMLRSSYAADSGIIQKYIEPFDFEKVIEIIERR